MENRSADTPLLPSQKTILYGIQIFVLCSLAGTLLGMWWKRPAGLGELTARLDWRFWIGLLPLIGLDYWLGGFRYRLFFNGKQLPFISQWDCMRSNWANMFMGAATPFQTGGAPAQLYVLWKKGASVTNSLLVSMVNYVATLLFFLLSSLAALAYLPDNLFGENFGVIFRSGFGVITTVVSLTLMVLFFPQTGKFLIKGVLSVLPIKKEKKERVLKKAGTESQRFNDGFRSILQQNKLGISSAFLATCLLYFNKYLIGYVIVRAMGIEVPFDVFLCIQVIQMLLLYFAPTPGASGLAEVSTIWLMSALMPASLLLVYTVFYRLSTTMLGALAGGVVIIQEMRSAKAPRAN